MRHIRKAVMAVGAVLTIQAISHAGVLGVAENYNAFIFQDMGDSYGYAEGAVAVGGNASLFDYDVATSLTAGTNVVIGGNLSFASDNVSGNMIGGSVIANQSITMDNGGPTGDVTTNESFAGTGGPTMGGTIYYLDTYSNAGPNTYNTMQLSSPVPLPVDFASAQTDLLNTSNQLMGLTNNGSTSINLFDLTLTGTQTGLNVFSVNADDLMAATSISINLPTGAFAVINVIQSPDSYGAITLPAGITTNGYDPTDVLWNFNSFTTMTILDSFAGSILTPSANVVFVGGDLSGTLVANSLSGSGQFFSSDTYNHNIFVPLPASIYAGVVLLTGTAISRWLVRRSI